MQNPALNPYGFHSLIAQADAVGLATMLILLAMSIASWYVIAARGAAWLASERRASAPLEAFRRTPDLAHAERLAAQDAPGDPYAALARAALHAAQHPALAGAAAAAERDRHIAQALRRALGEIAVRRESGLTVLASVGSVAPFVGLFGTVWGIYHALAAIGASGQASLEQVAGPVGEALLMTAAGLAVAVPAVLAYNGFVRDNRVRLARLECCAQELHALLVLGARAPAAAGERAAPSERCDAAALAAGLR